MRDIGTLIRTSPHVFAGVCSCNEADKTVSAPADCYKNSTADWLTGTQHMQSRKCRERKDDLERRTQSCPVTIRLLTMPLRRLRRSPTVATTGIALVLVASRTYGLSVQLCHCDQSRLGRSPTAESDQTVKVEREDWLYLSDNDGINISGSIIFSIETRATLAEMYWNYNTFINMYRPLQLLFHIEISRGVEICNKPLPASPLGTECGGF